VLNGTRAGPGRPARSHKHAAAPSAHPRLSTVTGPEGLANPHPTGKHPLQSPPSAPLRHPNADHGDRKQEIRNSPPARVFCSLGVPVRAPVRISALPEAKGERRKAQGERGQTDRRGLQATTTDEVLVRVQACGICLSKVSTAVQGSPAGAGPGRCMPGPPWPAADRRTVRAIGPIVLETVGR
jgi:hypothetical protein